MSTTQPGEYAQPSGAAHVAITELLAIIDALTGGAS